MSSEVHAIVLNWNEYKQTKDCLSSLNNQSYGNLRIWLIDNNSTNGAREKLQREFPQIDHIHSPWNRGFAGGMNLGITKALEAGAEYIWILNNDIVLEDPEILSKLVFQLESVGISLLSPRILDESGDVWFEQGAISKWSGSSSHTQLNNLQNSPEQVIRSDYVPYCAALFESRVFSEVGMMPEKYFMYYEDVAHCFMMSEGSIGVSTTVDVTHRVSGSSDGALGKLQTYYVYRNQLIFILKNIEKISKAAPVLYLLTIIYGITRRIYRRKINLVIPLLRGVYHALQGKTGRGPYP